jgi:DNA-binding transcriptional ArsR family regulator
MVTGKPAHGDVFRALADPTRRAILDSLRVGRQPVGRIARGFRVSRPAISRHLRVLRQARLVIERKEGRQRVCELNVQPLRHVDDWLNEYRRFWAGKLQRLKKYAESQE